MRILLLENVSEISLPQIEPRKAGPDVTPLAPSDLTPKIYHWKVAGINSWSTSEHLNSTKPCFDASKLQLLLRDARTFAVLDVASLQLTSLDATTAILEDCAAVSLSADGKLAFGLQWSEEFVVLCNPDEDVKHIRSGYGMTLGKRPSLYTRLVSRVQGLFGSTSGSTMSELELKMDPIDTLFPLMTPSNDGLALLCFFKPGEGFLFTCNYSAALRHKHIGNIVGSKVPGRWWKILMDEDIVLTWAKGKGVPSVETQLTFLEKQSETRSVQGAIIYSVFVNRRLEILYGMLANPDGHYELKWGLLRFELDLVVPDAPKSPGSTNYSEESGCIEEKPHFVIKVNSKADKIAIAVNSHAGVYVYVQDLPGTTFEVKMERVRVPLCPHCDYGNAVYYDKECWISCIEWVADDCYLALSTRCGCLCFFHKTGEPIITKVVDNGLLAEERCDFYTQIFNGRGPNTPLETSEGISELQSMKEIDLKWSGPGTNVLTISNGSKVYVERILRVSNKVELSDITIPSALSLARSYTSDIKNHKKSRRSISKDRPSESRHRFSKTNNNDNEEVITRSENKLDAGEQIISKMNAFVKKLPEAEIILRPVVVQQASSTDNKVQNRNNRPVEYKFGNQKENTADEGESQGPENEIEVGEKEAHQVESPEGLERLTMDFELSHKNEAPKNYYADDEMTVQSDEKNEVIVMEARPESSNRSRYTGTDNESCKTVESDIGSVIDSAYSPPFTEQEDEDVDESPNKPIKPSRKTSESAQFLRLTLPQSPEIEGVIPFAPINLTDDPVVLGKRIPSSSRSASRSRSPSRTGILEDNRGEKSLCIIIEPPPKPLDRKFCIMSPMVQLTLPSESDTQEDNHDIQENDAFGTSNELKDEKLDDDLSQLEQMFEIDEDSNFQNPNEETNKSSRAVWEEVSGMFSPTKPTPRNPKQMNGSNPPKSTGKRGKGKPKPKSKESAQTTEKESQNKTSSPVEMQASLEQFFRKAPPTRDSKDDMLEYLRSKLLSTTTSTTNSSKSHLAALKLRKLETIIQLREVNEVPKSPKQSDSVGSTKASKDVKPPRTSATKLRAESQPNFLKTTSLPSLKKSNASEPQLNRSLLKFSPPQPPRTSPKPTTGSSSHTAQVKVKTPPSMKKSVLGEFTIASNNANASRQKGKVKPGTAIASRESAKKSVSDNRPATTGTRINRKYIPAFNNLTLGPQSYIDKSFAAFAKKSKSAFLNSQKDYDEIGLNLKKSPNVPGSATVLSQTSSSSFTVKGLNLEENKAMMSLFQAYLEQSSHSNNSNSISSLPTRVGSNNSLKQGNISPSPVNVKSTKPQSPAPSVRRPVSPLNKYRKRHSSHSPERSVKTQDSKGIGKNEENDQYIHPDRVFLITKSGHTIPLSSASNHSLSSEHSAKPDAVRTNRRPITAAAPATGNKVRGHLSPSESEASSFTDENSNRRTHEGTGSDGRSESDLRRSRGQRNKQVNPPPPATSNFDAAETTDEELHERLKQKAGMSLTIYPEVMEDVPLQMRTKAQLIKKIDKPMVKSTSNFGENPELEDDNRKVQRRVSFSDPIAVFKTMSPDNLLKDGEQEEDSADDEPDQTPSYRLRRMYTQLFDY